MLEIIVLLGDFVLDYAKALIPITKLLNVAGVEVQYWCGVHRLTR